MSVGVIRSPFIALTNDISSFFHSKSLSGDLDNYTGLPNVLRQHLSDKQHTSRLVSDAINYLDDDRFLRGNSHVHVHGFTKLGLYRCSERGFSVRLHIWWSGPDASDESPHEHRWSFCSMLLSGALRIRNFSKVPNQNADPQMAKGDRWYVYRYWDASPDGVKRIDQVGVRHLVRGSEFILGPGACHMLHFEEPHQVIGTPGPVAATLVVTDAAQRQFSYVYQACEQSTLSYSFGGTRLAAKEVGSMLERYCCALR
jgi:hypothetical protein